MDLSNTKKPLLNLLRQPRLDPICLALFDNTFFCRSVYRGKSLTERLQCQQTFKGLDRRLRFGSGGFIKNSLLLVGSEFFDG